MTTTLGDAVDELAMRRARPGPGLPAPGGALDDLYRTHRLGLVRLGVLLLGDQSAAEDAVQDVFVSLWRRGGTPPTEAIGAYLRTAVVNRCRSAQRRTILARRKTAPGDVPAPGPEGRIELAEEHRAVLAAIEGLPRRQREIVVLRYYSGLSVAEVAESLGVHEGTVKSTCARALTTLRAKLGENA